MSKRVLIEISSLSDSTLSKSGVTNYIQGLIGGLLQIDADNNYTLAGFVGEKEYYDTVNPPFKARNSTYKPLRMFSRQTYLRLLKLGINLPFNKLVGGSYDVAMFSNFVAWPISSKKTSIITVVHDLSFEKYPQYVDRGNGRYLRRFTRKTCRGRGHIIALSESTKRDLVDLYGMDNSRITVIPPAIDHQKFKKSSETQISRVKKRYGLKGDYILFVGNVEPRKNLVRVLGAYNNLAEDIRSTHPLVLAGSTGWNDAEIQAKLAELDKKNITVVTTGFVEADDLPHLYSGASVFLYPSVYEGFGIPVLEAMACGVPVISSKVSSLPEVAGNAAVLVDPLQISEITEALQNVLTDTKLRKKMITKGYEQGKQYSWARSAQALKALIQGGD